MARGKRTPPAMRSADLAIITLGAAVFLLVLGALIAVGLASLLFGGGWVWPDGVSGAVREVGALAGGDPTRGLAAANIRRVPSVGAVWPIVVFVEIIALAVALMLARAVAPMRPSGERTGFAGRADAAAVLGRGQLPGRRIGKTSRPREGWLLGKTRHARGLDLWVPFDRMAGVMGPSRPDDTGDVLAQADLAAPGGLLRVCTDPDDLLVSLTQRSNDERPVYVCDPSGLLPGLPPLVWDPLGGCIDSTGATRRAVAFAAGTVLSAAAASGDGVGARFYAAEAAKVLQGYFLAAALTGRRLDHVMEWVADPLRDETAATILTEHPHAETHWAGLLQGALRASPNTVATVQHAMRPFMHREVARRCTPSHRQPVTKIADVLRQGGTIYLLGQDDVYASVSPLFTAITENVLDVAEQAFTADPANTRRFTVTVDHLPMTAPIPTLPKRLASGSRRGLSMVWSAPHWRQLLTCYGDTVAQSITRSTDVLVLLDSDAPDWVNAPTWAHPESAQAVVVVGASPPIIARLRRSADDASLRADLEGARARLADHPARRIWRWDPSVAAITVAREQGLHAESKGLVTYRKFGDAGRETFS